MSPMAFAITVPEKQGLFAATRRAEGARAWQCKRAASKVIAVLLNHQVRILKQRAICGVESAGARALLLSSCTTIDRSRNPATR
jgi:hypothetical protein